MRGGKRLRLRNIFGIDHECSPSQLVCKFLSLLTRELPSLSGVFCSCAEVWKQRPRCRESRSRFRNQPGIVLRECEAWTVVDRNSRNARVFGARYWRDG